MSSVEVSTWHPILEKCGVILKTGEIVELINESFEPDQSFKISQEAVDNIGLDNIETFWHSHPSNNSNLSLEDYFTFIKYPDHKHRIYVNDHFVDYYVRNGLVIRELL